MSAPQMARMPWYPRDFRSSTLGWPLVARAVYREMLDAQWDAGSLPADPQQLRVIANATAAEWRVAWPLVEPKLPICSDGHRRNARLEAHRDDALKRYESHRQGAAKTNRKRWGKSAPRCSEGAS